MNQPPQPPVIFLAFANEYREPEVEALVRMEPGLGSLNKVIDLLDFPMREQKWLNNVFSWQK